MIKIVLIFAAIFVAAFADVTCPSATLNKCETQIQKAFQYCEQAAKQKGQDQTADLNCMKWALTVEKDCWGCVCVVAKKEGWKIKGCDTILKVVEALEIAKQLRDAQI